MKRNHLKRTYALAASALAISAAFVGCRDYDVFDENAANELAAAKNFDQHFIERFGEPAEGHDWGMKLLEAASFGNSEMTRATENNVNTSRNQWCERETTLGKYKTHEGVLINTIKVPGWPNFDGYFYGNRGTSAWEGAYKYDEIFTNQYVNIQPCGDVTDYEINYVSTWFRTHKNPQKTPLHLTDFFIQNISQDNDQLFYNDAQVWSPANHNILPGGYPKSGQKGNDGNSRSQWWNGDNAKFVNDVVESGTNNRRSDVGSYIKVRHQDGHLNSNENLNYSVDYLHFGAMDRQALAQNSGLGDGWTHVNNFNNGNSNFDPENSASRDFREIKYVHSSGTEDFACRSSMDNNNNWINDWVLVHLEWQEAGADGVVRTRDGYYLGFDFAMNTNDTKIEGDGFYSNWIIKITPALFNKSEKTARVMCEDLGGTFDFDFNDVVFDAAYDSNAGQVVICLLASGGTLPIVVGPENKYEAHYMLGESDYTKPVNVDSPVGTKRDVAIYRVGASEYLTDGRLDIKKIPVNVKQGDSWKTTTDIIGEDAWTEDQYGHRNDPEGSKTPRKFATAIGVNWMKEMQFIGDGYQKFIEWVKNPNYTYEVVVTETGAKQTLYWYDDTTNKDLIYQGPKDPVINSTNPTANPVSWLSLATIPVTNNFSLINKAVDYITIGSYSGTNSIIEELKAKPDNAPVTFAYITKAVASTYGPTDVHGVLFPIWIIDGQPTYVRPDGNMITITETSITKPENYRTAVWQSNFIRSGENGSITPTTDMGQGVDADGNYTYVTKITFSKSDLYIDVNGDGTKDYCDYIAFYVLEDVSSNPYSSAAVSGTQGMMGNAGPVKKYECYVIF